MKMKYIVVGSFAVLYSLSQSIPVSAQMTQSQVDSGYQRTTTTTTTSYPPPASSSSMSTTTTMHQPISGEVRSVSRGDGKGATFFNKEVEKTITLEPGFNQYSLDGIHWGDKVSLTLVNPTDAPLQFETVQRWGRPYAVVVPPHSQQYVSFIHSRPFTKEEKFNVMREPTNSIAANQDYFAQQTAASTVGPVPTAVTTTTTTETTAETMPAPQAPEQRSAVRGYW